MADVLLHKQKVDPEKVSRLKDWMTDVGNRSDEAIETLRNEGVYTETAFLEETADGTYLLTYMEADDLERARDAFEDSPHEIDAEFERILRDCLEEVETAERIEPLYHLANPER